MISEILRTAQLQPTTQELLVASVHAAEQAYATGEALGAPANCYLALEVDYNLVESDDLDTLSQRQYREAYGRSKLEVKQDRWQLQSEGRQRIYGELAALTPADEYEQARQAHWLAQVEKLTLPELVTYFAYRELSQPTLANIKGLQHREPTDNSIVEFVFGQDIYQAGYYDNPDNPELRTVPKPPAEALANHDRIVEVFEEYGRRYGMSFVHKGCQINFSVQDMAGRTLHTLDDEAGQNVAKQTAAEMLIALRDIAPVLLPAVSRYAKPTVYSAGPKRTDMLRVLPDRFECRRSSLSRSALYANTIALMSGFARGVQTIGESTVRGAEPVNCGAVSHAHFVPAPGFSKKNDLHTLRALQHSIMEADGTFTVDDDYADERAIQIVQPLFDSKYAGVDFAIMGSTVKGLMRAFKLSPDQKLVIDNEALQKWWSGLGTLSKFAIGADTPHENGPLASLLQQKLQRVTLAGTVTAIRSSKLHDQLTPLTWHQSVARFAGSAALQPLFNTAARQQVASELTILFSYEQMAAEEVDVALIRDLHSVAPATLDEGEASPVALEATESLKSFLDNCDASTLLTALHVSGCYLLASLKRPDSPGATISDTRRRQRIFRLLTAWTDHLVSLSSAHGVELDNSNPTA